MPIIFDPLVWSPVTTGTASTLLPKLAGIGLQTAGDYGIGALPATVGFSDAVYGTLTLGTGLGALPAIRGYGVQQSGGWGISDLPAFTSAGLDLSVFTPQSGAGLGVLPGMSSVNGEAMYAYGAGTMPAVRSYGLEVAGNWSVGIMPGMASRSINVEITGEAYFAMGVDVYATAYASTAYAEVVETMATSESITYDITYAVVEHMLASVDLYGVGHYSRELIAAMSVRDRVQVVYEELLTELLIAGDDMLASVVKTVAILDSLNFRDVLTSQRMYSANVIDALTIASVARSVVLADITDPMVASEALTGRRAAMAHLLEGMLTSDLLSGVAVFTVDLTDTFIAEDSVLGTMTLHALIEDGVRVSVGLSLDGVPYVATVMNVNTRGITEYAPYDFNSVATYRGETYGAGPAGLFRLSGETDNGAPIEAYARTALSRIAGGKLAQVDSAYLGYSSDGTVQLKTIVTEPNGSKTSRVYQLNSQNADASRSGRIKLGRGVKSAYWSFEISNVLGADFTIDVVEMHVLALSRRI